MENLMAFVPVGLLLGFAVPSLTWRRAILTGAGLGLATEAAQWLWRGGGFDAGDVVFNTAGCAAGYGLYRIIRWMAQKDNKR